MATTSTTSGADLLVSGEARPWAEVRKIGLPRPNPTATTLAPIPIATLPPLAGVVRRLAALGAR